MEKPHFVPEPSSFRDPSGFVFKSGNEVYRQVNLCFKNEFETFIASGLYTSLVTDGLLIPHQTINKNFTGKPDWFTTIKPEPLGFISYPYEWSFGMLKDAALLTLELAIRSLAYGMALKDASAFNVQFYKGRMVFIDTLSVEIYREGEPWLAYRQFCEQFLGPLALMHYTGLPMQKMHTAYPEGIPLPYLKKLLPYRSRFHLNVYLHLHLHASYSKKGIDNTKKIRLSKQKLLNLFKNLQATVGSFQLKESKTVWGNYYAEAATRPGYLEEKKQIVTELLSVLPSLKSVLDVGGNTGEFSALARAAGRQIICADGEHDAIESLYQQEKGKSDAIIPLIIDFANPSPAVGVNNAERISFFNRGSSQLLMMLAFIHHLAIGKNISFDLIADMCRQLGEFLIIEFIPKEDEKVRDMLHQKRDVYNWYSEEAFLVSFKRYYRVREKRPLTSMARTLFLMQRL